MTSLENIGSDMQLAIANFLTADEIGDVLRLSSVSKDMRSIAGECLLQLSSQLNRQADQLEQEIKSVQGKVCNIIDQVDSRIQLIDIIPTPEEQGLFRQLFEMGKIKSSSLKETSNKLDQIEENIKLFNKEKEETDVFLKPHDKFIDHYHVYRLAVYRLTKLKEILSKVNEVYIQITNYSLSK